MSARSLSILTIIAFTLCCTSCKKDMFDDDAYQNLIKETAPIGDIDASHNWKLSTTHTIEVTANITATNDVRKVRLLAGNPYKERNVEILAEADISKGEKRTFSLVGPIVRQQLFAAIVDSEENHFLRQLATDATTASFETDIIEPGEKLNKPVYQGYTYCFEEDYPQPSSDWDFNDVVLRIRKMPSQQSSELRLSVTLAAVGAKKQIAAAVRIMGLAHSDVESVTTAEGRTFDGEYKEKRVLIEDGSLLLSGRGGEAVLNLFEDAHWAMSPRVRQDGMGVVRMYYNTHLQVDGTTSAQIYPKTLTYIIKLREGKDASALTLENLDPFIVEDFNSGKWEVHTFDYKADGVLHDYGSNETASSNRMVWALKIPTANFRYPIEGTSMGYFKDGILTGAYMESGHSFGQWVQNKDTCLDWFYYPASGLVY